MFFDLMGAAISFLSTYYFIRLNNKAWPIGMIATCLNGWLYWRKGIYADMVLEFFYFLSMGYGWYIWNHSSYLDKNDSKMLLSRLNALQWTVLILVFFSIFSLIHYVLQTQIHSNVALLDATTTSLSLLAQWLMCHKIIATWVIWFITDALYLFLYHGKNLPFHCLLMMLYSGMAVTGYMIWTKHAKTPQRWM